MNYLLNIYKSGNIVKTEVLASQEEASENFNAYLDTLDNDFEKGCSDYSCTPTAEELTEAPEPAPKKSKSTKNK